MSYFVYILRNDKNKLYIGQTQNIEERLTRHKVKQGARFVGDLKNFKLAYSEDFPTLLEAMRREKQLKGWTRAKKEALISGKFELLKRL